MIDLLGKILTNILTALYEPFGFALLLSFLAMFFYLYAYEPTTAGKGWKNAIVTWYRKFKESVCFRKLFFLAFVTSLILFRTLLNRKMWMNPLSDVMGGWGIWETVNGERQLTTECIKSIGFSLEDGSIYSGMFDLMVGGEVQAEVVNHIQHYRESPLVQKAILDMKTLLEKRQASKELEERPNTRQSVREALKNRKKAQEQQSNQEQAKPKKAKKKGEMEL